MTKTCKNCGTIASDSSLFCKNCGAKLDESPTNIRTQMVNNNPGTVKKDNTHLYIIVGLIAIICALGVVGAVLYTNSAGNANAGNLATNVSNTQSTNTASTSSANTGLTILGGSFSTGSALSDKTYCTVNVGSEHAGETVGISVLYSRDGSNLNGANIVYKTVASDGTIEVASAYGFDYYPDFAVITLYYSDGSVACSQEVSMNPSSGTQSF